MTQNTDAEVAVEQRELLPCPFCENNHADVRLSVVSSMGGQVVCDDCAAAGSWMATEAEAISAWNTRHRLATEAPLARADEKPTKHGWPSDGFYVEYDDADDDFTVNWPDGRYLVAHRNGRIVTGQSPQSLGIAPVSTTITTLARADRGEVERVLYELTLRAGELNIACDGMEELRPHREALLASMKQARAAIATLRADGQGEER